MELIVVISVVGLLATLLLPAVQSVREGARLTSCRNNLRQIGSALLAHEAMYRRFPANGWGYNWIGDPDRATDERQPGGWIYNILSYLEGNAARRVGMSLADNEKREKLAELMRTPQHVFKCPTRPGPTLALHSYDARPVNATYTPWVAKSDYAINEGDFITNTPAGPITLLEGDNPRYPWTRTEDATGICFLRSRIRFSEIRDGASSTILVGEKYIPKQHYEDDTDLGNDQSMYVGVDLDINRWTIDPPLQDSDKSGTRRFGSSHSNTCQFVMCDGAVKSISYGIDQTLFRRLGNRRDGHVVELP